jgi:hypothetical protein
MTGKRFAAEVLFLNPSDIPRIVEALAAVNCELEIDRDAIDDCGPTVFGMVIGVTELDENKIGTWLGRILWPLGGDVVQWRFGPPWKIAD